MGQSIDLEITWDAEHFFAARDLETNAQKELVATLARDAGAWGTATLRIGLVHTKISGEPEDFAQLSNTIRGLARKLTGDEDLRVKVEFTISHSWGTKQ